MLTSNDLNKLFNKWSYEEAKCQFFISSQRNANQIYFDVGFADQCRGLLYKFFLIGDDQINQWITIKQPVLFNPYLTPITIEIVTMYKKLEHTNNIRIYNPQRKPLKFVFFDVETAEILTPEQINQLKEAALIRDPTVRQKQRWEVRKNGIVLPWLVIYKVDGCSEVKLSLYQDDKHEGFLTRLRQLAQIYCVVLVGHNIQYDIRAMVPIYERGGISTYTKLKDGDFYLSGYSEDDKQNFSISYLDTFFFYRETLEKSSGLQKKDVPYGLVNPIVDKVNDKVCFFSNLTLKDEEFSLSLYQTYGVEDVLAVEKLHYEKHDIISRVQELVGHERKPEQLTHLSQSGLSEWFVRELSRKAVNEDVYRLFYRYPVSVEEYEIERRSIMGGWSPINNKDIYTEARAGHAIYKFDVTSLYPYISSKGLPAGELYDFYPEWLEAGEVITWHKLRTIPEQSPRFKDKYSFFSVGLHKEEWFMPKHCGEIYIVEDLYNTYREYYKNFDDCFEEVGLVYQERHYHHSEAYKYLFPLKQQADLQLKIETDEEIKKDLHLTRKVVKLLLNGGLGKLEQRSFHNAKYQTNRETLNELVPLNKRNLRTSKSGFYIPQMGRSILASVVTKAVEKGFKVYRCDTDSILLEAPYRPDIPNPELINIFGQWWKDNKIGGWTLEGIYARQYSFGVAKKYLLEPFDQDLNRTDWITKGLAFSGITRLPQVITHLALNNRARYEELKSYLVPFKNLLFKGCKNTSKHTYKYNQPIIDVVDVKLVDRGPGKNWPVDYVIELKADDFIAIPILQYRGLINEDLEDLD